jgi:hypothetical protein
MDAQREVSPHEYRYKVGVVIEREHVPSGEHEELDIAGFAATGTFATEEEATELAEAMHRYGEGLQETRQESPGIPSCP